MDIIFITGIRVSTLIGIYPHEREERQPVLIDLELQSDIRAAAAEDDFAQALDYEAICQVVVDFVASTEFQLVETLAEATARLILERFNVSWLKLTLHKPQALSAAQDVGLIIERQRRIPSA